MTAPNRNRVVFSESDVTGPAGLQPNDAYDLTLYESSSDGTKGVLMVSMRLQMRFLDGEDAAGSALEWDFNSRTQFLSDYRSSIQSIWNDCWKITSGNTSAAIEEVSVMFEFEMIVRNWFSSAEHWELNITKTDGFRQSWVNPFFGTSSHDSEDVNPVRKRDRPSCSGGSICGIMQRGSVHEFGHMLGLRDEYPEAGSNSSWKTDGESVMHSGEIVRPRHYAIFANWLNGQYARIGRLAGESIEFKVDGRWDLSNSRL